MTVSVRSETDLAGLAPAVGLFAQFVLLVVLSVGVGLGLAGWLAGAAFGVGTWALLTRARHRAGVAGWGPADTITLARATLVGCVTALVADATLVAGAIGGRTPAAVLVMFATVALILDAVDGPVARRTGTTSPLGARFDMETDAFLILVLSVFVAPSLGWWVLAIGAMRYVFVAAAWGLPWLRAPLPPRFSRKVVAAIQGIVLVVASAGVVPQPLAITAVGGALALLSWAFGRDVGWLWLVGQQAVRRSDPAPPGYRGTPAAHPDLAVPVGP